MNEEKHWNQIAPDYEEEIFDVFKSDKKGKLPAYFKKRANKFYTAIDFGCGVGKAFPYIAPIFKKVVGIDISEECLSIAKARLFQNVELLQLDLADPNLRLPRADFAFCCNVAILPEVEKNIAIINNVQKSLRKNGTALFVIPSLESILFAAWRIIDLYKREGVPPKKIPKSELKYFKGKKRRILQGLVEIDGVGTKHYTREEIEVVFREAGLVVTAIDKIEYSWETELSEPPSFVKEPYPWDWLVDCKVG